MFSGHLLPASGSIGLASIGCVRASSYAEIAAVILESLRHSPSWYTTCADLMVFVPSEVNLASRL